MIYGEEQVAILVQAAEEYAKELVEEQSQQSGEHSNRKTPCERKGPPLSEGGR